MLDRRLRAGAIGNMLENKKDQIGWESTTHIVEIGNTDSNSSKMTSSLRFGEESIGLIFRGPSKISNIGMGPKLVLTGFTKNHKNR
jgi:hypothetical protein